MRMSPTSAPACGSWIPRSTRPRARYRCPITCWTPCAAWTASATRCRSSSAARPSSSRTVPTRVSASSASTMKACSDAPSSCRATFTTFMPTMHSSSSTMRNSRSCRARGSAARSSSTTTSSRSSVSRESRPMDSPACRPCTRPTVAPSSSSRRTTSRCRTFSPRPRATRQCRPSSATSPRSAIRL